MRMTTTTQMVLMALLDDPAVERFGAEIRMMAGLASGTIYPILARLEAVGWLESRWEGIDARVAGRPARRYYRLSAEGEACARAALARAHRPRIQLRPLGGEA
jgi:PadR family transcriptional regulator, regulatory protein PadR